MTSNSTNENLRNLQKQVDKIDAKQSDTPRSDEECRKGCYLKHGDFSSTVGHQFVHVDFARQLERELNEAKRVLEECANQFQNIIDYDAFASRADIPKAQAMLREINKVIL